MGIPGDPLSFTKRSVARLGTERFFAAVEEGAMDGKRQVKAELTLEFYRVEKYNSNVLHRIGSLFQGIV